MAALRALAELADTALHRGLDGRQNGGQSGVDLLVPLHRGKELAVVQVLGDAEVGKGVDVGVLVQSVPVKDAPNHKAVYHLVFATRSQYGLWVFGDALAQARNAWWETLELQDKHKDPDAIFTTTSVLRPDPAVVEKEAVPAIAANLEQLLRRGRPLAFFRALFGSNQDGSNPTPHRPRRQTDPGPDGHVKREARLDCGSASKRSEGGIPGDRQLMPQGPEHAGHPVRADHADKPKPSRPESVLTAGCLLFLVLAADAAATLVVFVALLAQGLGHRNAGCGQTSTGVKPGAVPSDQVGASCGPHVYWWPVIGYGVVALAMGVTAVVLWRIGNRVIGSVQLMVCALLTGQAL